MDLSEYADWIEGLIGKGNPINIQKHDAHSLVRDLRGYALKLDLECRTSEVADAALHEAEEENERLVSKLDAANQTITDLHAQNMCDVCAGNGTPISDAPCICGGSGKMSDAAYNMRHSIYDQNQEIERLQSRLDSYRQIIEKLTADLVCDGCGKLRYEREMFSDLCIYCENERNVSRLSASQAESKEFELAAEDLSDSLQKCAFRLDSAIGAWRNMAIIDNRYSPEFYEAMMRVLKAIETPAVEGRESDGAG